PLSLPPMFRDHPTSTSASRARSFARSWAGAAVISVGIHALLFLLATAGLGSTVIRPPVDAYLATPNDWNGAQPDSSGSSELLAEFAAALRPAPLVRTRSS